MRRLLLVALVALIPSAVWAASGMTLLGAGPPGQQYNPLGASIMTYTAIGTDVALGVTNTKTLTQSFLLNGTVDNTNDTTIQTEIVYSNAVTQCETNGSTASPGFCDALDNAAHRIQFNYNNSVGLSTSTDTVKVFCATCGPSNGNWHWYFTTFDSATGAKAFYIDDVLQTTTFTLNANVIPDLNNVGGFHIFGKQGFNASGSGWIADYSTSEVSFACTGVGAPFADCTGANTAPASIRHRFWNNGKPVDPGQNFLTAYAGRQPEVGLTGNGGTMSVNVGTGGALAVQSASTSTGAALYVPAYGPAGMPAHQATLRWPVQSKAIATVTGGTSMSCNLGSMTAIAGDAVSCTFSISNSSGTTNYHMLCPSGGANTWLQIGPVLDPTGSMNSETCVTILQAGDTTGPWTATWDAGGGARTHSWSLSDYGQVASIDVTGSIYNGPSKVTSHPTAAGLTTVSANDTCVSILVNQNAAGPGWPFLPPALPTQTRYRIPNIGTPGEIMTADDYAVPAGSNPQRTFTSNGADTSAGYTICLVPN